MLSASDKGPHVAVIGTRGYPSYYGGFETAIRHLAPALADDGWQVTVYGRPHQALPEAAERDMRVCVRTTRGMDSRSLSTLTYGLSAVIDTIRRRPDVALVMNCANGYWIPLLWLVRIPTLVNVDGIEWERAKWSPFAQKVFKVGAVLTARFATELVFDARAIGKYWLNHFRRTGSVIAYGGIEMDGVLPLHEDDAHLPDRSYALIVARFVPENTVSEFLVAAQRIAEQFPVVIVGSSGYGGDLDKAAHDLARSNENISWAGHVADDRRLFALWQHAGAYFHGHTVGGTNPALVQAMHCGAPVVARDTVYNREVLGADGVFVSAEPDAIADAVIAMLAEPAERDQRAQRLQQRASSMYSWDRISEQYAAALGDLVRKPARRRRAVHE